MIRYLLMSNGKATKRLNALANSFRVPLRQLCSGMHNIGLAIIEYRVKRPAFDLISYTVATFLVNYTVL